MSAACPQFGFDVVLEPASDVAVGALFVLLQNSALAGDGLAVEASAAFPGRFTVTRDGGQATDADRQAVSGWAAAQPGIASCDVGPLVDLGPSA